MKLILTNPSITEFQTFAELLLDGKKLQYHFKVSSGKKKNYKEDGESVNIPNFSDIKITSIFDDPITDTIVLKGKAQTLESVFGFSVEDVRFTLSKLMYNKKTKEAMIPITEKDNQKVVMLIVNAYTKDPKKSEIERGLFVSDLSE